MLLRQVHFATITIVCIPLIFAVFVFVTYFHDGLHYLSPSRLGMTSHDNTKPSSSISSSTVQVLSTSTSAPDAATSSAPSAPPQVSSVPNSQLEPAPTPKPTGQNVFPGTDFLPARPVDPVCDNSPNVSTILLIIKTGASETYDRLPTQFMTMTRCLPDFLVFSDMEENILGYRAQDIAGQIIDKVKVDNDDYNLWRRQRDCLVDQENCQQWSAAGGEAWNLDKYKNVRQSFESYKLRPNYDWYLHIDADTYVHWPNMVKMLEPYDLQKDYFFGSFEPYEFGEFNHGGSGYILSQSAMKKFHEKVDLEHYDEQARGACCGDMLMTLAVKEVVDLPNTNMFPTINGRKPFTLPFGPRQWCHPIATLHKLNSEEVASVWDFEQRRIKEHKGPISTLPPLLIKDLYYEFFQPKLVPKLEDWDNMYDDYLNNVWYYFDENKRSKDWKKDNGLFMGHLKKDKLNAQEKKAYRSFDDCRAACEAVDECLQFRWQDNICAHSKNFRLGNPKRKEEKEHKRWMSGWAVEKINKWIDSQPECVPEFPKP